MDLVLLLAIIIIRLHFKRHNKSYLMTYQAHFSLRSLNVITLFKIIHKLLPTCSMFLILSNLQKYKIKIYYQSCDYKYLSYYLAFCRNLCLRAYFISALVAGSGSNSLFIKSMASTDSFKSLGKFNSENYTVGL